MELGKDVRFLLLLGAGIIAASWAFVYAGSVNQLVQTGTNGYVTMVNGLEPPQVRGGAGVAGGAGNIPASVAQGYGGAPTYMGGYGA